MRVKERCGEVLGTKTTTTITTQCGENTSISMNKPSVRVIVGGGGWGKQQLFINNHQSME